MQESDAKGLGNQKDGCGIASKEAETSLGDWIAGEGGGGEKNRRIQKNDGEGFRDQER